MNIDINLNEQRLLVAALDVKAQEQYKKLINPHLDIKYVPTYLQVHTELVNLHTKISRLNIPGTTERGED